MAERQTERRSIWRVGPESTWTTIVPVVFIIVSLLSLVVLPIWSSAAHAEMRREITEVAEPARQRGERDQMDLSAELDKIIAFQVTGQEQYRREYLRVRRSSRRADAEKLRLLAPKLDADVQPSSQTVSSESSQWHSGVRQRASS